MSRAHDFKAWLNSAAPWRARQRDPRYADYPMAQQKLGALVGHLDTICGGERERRSFLKFLFDVDSSKQLTCRQQNALYLWLDPQPGEGGRWTVREQARQTALEVVRAAMVEAGQMEMPFGQ